MKKVLVSGGTGFIGRRLVEELLDKGHEVYILSRTSSKVESLFNGRAKAIEWASYKETFESSELKDLYAVVGLMGESIVRKRWSEKQKQEIHDSRVIGTQNIIASLEKMGITPEVYILASAVGIYGNTFLSSVARGQEEVLTNSSLSCRKAILRLPAVLGTEGGVVKETATMFKLGMGATLGRGNMSFPWIHIDDLVQIFILSLENSELEGAFNSVSRFGTTNKEFSKVFAKLLNKPLYFKVPKMGVKVLKGELAESVFESLDVKPEKLNELKFDFKFPTIELALKDIVSKL